MNNYLDEFDIIVVGAGHAGIEAALIASKFNLKIALFTINIDNIANMPCNPSIGGTAKGHLVREIDALGGYMAIAADHTFIQSRILNRGKGNAVHSLRVQTDKTNYHNYMKILLEKQSNILLKQGEITDIILENNAISGVLTKVGSKYKCKSVILSCGTYLNSKIHVGDFSYLSGPDGNMYSCSLTSKLVKYGIEIRRFKTGTPARVHKRSINFSKLQIQYGDSSIVPFSFLSNNYNMTNKVCCHIAYTNLKTHQIILDNINKSPIYNGKILSSGPRYCPSIEDKIIRFSDKNRHQIFVEPMGLNTDEMYLQGMSSSLPEDIQVSFLKSIDGFENIEIIRNAHAIEYDCCDPTQLYPTLEFKNISGLFGAGQFNGTSGYEEAAAQGIIAGINASLKILKRDPLILDRSTSYIGVLIDDLVTKGCSEPYRIMTSKSEYRLLLRQDNADQRLTPIAKKIGIISDIRWNTYLKKMSNIKQESDRISKVIISPTNDLNKLLVSRETSKISSGISLKNLLKRPQITYNDIKQFDFEKSDSITNDIIEQVEIELKYEGYIKKQLLHVKNMLKLEKKKLSNSINYFEIKGLRLEAQEKLSKIKPISIGQASRISGVTPADISALLIWIKHFYKEK